MIKIAVFLGLLLCFTRSFANYGYDVQSYEFDLELDFSKKRLAGTVDIHVKALRPLKTVRLDSVDIKIKSVSQVATSRRLAHRLGKNQLIVNLPQTLKKGEGVTLSIEYVIDKTDHHSYWDTRKAAIFVRPDSFNPEISDTFFTTVQPNFARNWFPCHDTPSDKASFVSMKIRVPKAMTAVGNGVLQKVEEQGESKTFYWRENSPIATYLISLAVSKFEKDVVRSKGVELSTYTDQKKLAVASREFTHTEKIFDFFSEYIGPYPFEKYSNVLIPLGDTAMENQTASIIERGRVDGTGATEGLNGHELAHQWFGNAVTLKNWGHMWLNEGFASYMPALYFEAEKGKAWFQRYMHRKMRAYFGEARSRDRVMVDESIDPKYIFSAANYDKGAWVLHMLRNRLGDVAFRKAVRKYYAEFKHKTVKTEDLKRVFEEASGQDLSFFFAQWLYRRGYPKISVRSRWDPSKKSLRVDLEQTQEGGIFAVDFEIGFWTPQGYAEKRVSMSGRKQSWSFPFAQKPDMFLDPNLNLLARFESAAAPVKDSAKWWVFKSYLRAEVPSMSGSEVSELLKEAPSVPNLEQILLAVGERTWEEGEGRFLRTQILPLLSHESSLIRVASLKALEKLPMSPEVFNAAQKALESDPGNWVQRATLAVLLKGQREAAFAVFSRRLMRGDENQHLKRALLRALAKTQDPRAVQTVQRYALKHSLTKTRAAAISAMSLFNGDFKLIESFRQIVSEDWRRFRERRAALRGLIARSNGKVETQKLRKLLLKISQFDKNLRFRSEAAKALEKVTAQ